MDSITKTMNDAIALANWFIDKSQENQSSDTPKLDLLRLVKLVYIAYGFGLALLDRCIIDERFDKVEAWKYGPVIPSVYHTFKYNKEHPIIEKASILNWDSANSSELIFVTPSIDKTDDLLVQMLTFVWNRYNQFSTSEIISMLHQKGTPWDYCYRQGQNVEIPKEMTKLYYRNLVKLLADDSK